MGKPVHYRLEHPPNDPGVNCQQGSDVSAQPIHETGLVVEQVDAVLVPNRTRMVATDTHTENERQNPQCRHPGIERKKVSHGDPLPLRHVSCTRPERLAITVRYTVHQRTVSGR